MDATYSLLFSDPPWHYNSRKSGGERKNKTKFGGGAQKHYPLMKDAELLAMRPLIDTLAEPNSAMLMWVTFPRLDFGIELLKAWGFRYTTAAFHWVKLGKSGSPIYGPGYYTASNLESVLIGVRGSMPPDVKMMPSIIQHPRMEHSRKPDVFYEKARLLYPHGRALEMFARRQRPGWDVWGN